MISSTAIDLPEHRKQVFEACLCEGVFPDGMESLPARDADAITTSMEMVNRADIYIGIFAWRYGHISQGHDISITEMEFNRAVERQIEVLIFLIDDSHPLVIGMVEIGDAAQTKLAALKERACKGRGRREFKSPAELRAHAIQALSALKQRQSQVGSPSNAIRAEEQRLEQLDPRFSVDIAATAESMDVKIRSIQPISEFPRLKFLGEGRTDALKAFLEKGQPFRVKAANVQVDNSPIHNDILRELGDAEITFTGLTFPGCLQFYFGPQAEPLCVQVDGEWVLAPKRYSFNGHLSESPLKVACICERGEDGKWKSWEVVFRLDWGAWHGQALLALAYFVEIDAFLREKDFLVRFYIRGHREWPAEKLVLDNPQKLLALEAMDWLQTCKRVAKRIGANPPFPAANAVGEIESNDVRLLVKLIEEGKHEQANAEQICAISADAPTEGSQPPKDIASMTVPEPVRTLSFFGVKVPIGPLKHTWTNVELVETRPLDNGRIEMIFKGRTNSIWKIEYKGPGAPVSPP